MWSMAGGDTLAGQGTAAGNLAAGRRLAQGRMTGWTEQAVPAQRPVAVADGPHLAGRPRVAPGASSWAQRAAAATSAMAHASSNVLEAATMATMTVGRAGHAAGAWRREGRALFALSVPIVLTNIGQVAIQTTDVVMIGWLGAEALAASVLGVNVMFVLLLFAIGVVIATAPMIAQDLGRNPHAVREPRRTVRQGFWVALAIGLPASLALWQIAPILRAARPGPGADRGGRALCPRRDVGLRAGALVRRAAQLHRRAGAAARRHGDHADRRRVQRARRLRPDLRPPSACPRSGCRAPGSRPR